MNSQPAQLGSPQLFLLSVVAILLLVVTTILIPFETQPKPAIFKTETLSFSNPFDKERFEELIRLGFQEKEKDKASDYLVRAFLSLSTEYNRQPSNEKRQALLTIASYLRTNLPDQAKNTNLDIPCKEESCGAVFIYSPELLAIKNKVTTAAAIKSVEKEAILLNLENAALAQGAKNNVGQFNSLTAAFDNLRAVWGNTKDITIKNLAEQVLALMEKVDKNLYQTGAKLGFFEFK